MIAISLKYDPNCLDLGTFAFHQSFHLIADKTFVVIEALCDSFFSVNIFVQLCTQNALRRPEVAEPQNYRQNPSTNCRYTDCLSSYLTMLFSSIGYLEKYADFE
jgi:hypothetical protein